MTTESTPQKRRQARRAPDGLSDAGALLWRRICAEYDISDREAAVLEAACRQADLNAQLEQLINTEGLVVAGSNGQPRLSAAVTEVRQGRLALARLLADLQLPEDDDDPVRKASPASARAAHAANVRWSAQRLRVARG